MLFIRKGGKTEDVVGGRRAILRDYTTINIWGFSWWHGAFLLLCLLPWSGAPGSLLGAPHAALGRGRRRRQVLSDEGWLGEEGDALQLVVVGGIDDALDGGAEERLMHVL